MKNSLMSAIKLLLLLAVAGGVFYHFKLSSVPVQTMQLQRQELTDTVFGTGTLEAKTIVAISPRSTSQLNELFADQGDFVKAGQTLCTMVADDLRQQIKVSESEYAVTRATLKRLEAEIASAQATYDYALQAYQRSERLFKSNIETEADFDKQTEARKVAEAVLEKTKTQKHEAELTLAKQEIQVEYYKTKLAETILVAPFDGLVLRRNRECGSVVNPGISIMDVADTKEIWASAWVDETAISKLSVGQKVQVVFRSEPEKTYSGTVRRLPHETDRETREFKVDVALDRLPDNWTLGQRLEIYIVAGKFADRLCIPSPMINWEKNQPFVLVVENGKIARRPVQIGLQTRKAVEILSGLDAGDCLVLSPNEHLAHIGRKAEIKTP